MPTQPLITEEQIMKVVDHMGRGEYDCYHERSASFSFEDKTGFLEKMLQDWKNTEPAGQKAIINFIKTLINEAGRYNYYVLTNLLVQYNHIPEIIKGVENNLCRGFFSRDILLSMQAQGRRQPQRIEKIREFAKGRKFMEKHNTYKLVDMYQDIDNLLVELS